MKWVFSAFVVLWSLRAIEGRTSADLWPNDVLTKLIPQKSREVGGYLIRLPSGQNSREDAASWSVARRLRLTVWNRNFDRLDTHRGPYKDGPGAINVPVSVGGLTIRPGDIVVGDQDGLLAFAPEEAEEF